MVDEKTIEEIVLWLRQAVEEAGASGVIYGLSGGIDSAVVGAICNRAFGNKCLGLIMPIESDEKDEKDARLLEEKLGLNVDKLDLTKIYHQYLNMFDDSEIKDISKENLKSRLRMLNLYFLGQNKNYLVLGPTNLSELTIGYFTKYGDSGVDLMPIANFVKREVYELGEILGIPKEIMEKTPSAGLRKGQTDQDDMGFTYKELDSTIRDGIPGENFEKINRLNRISKHKREYPRIFPN